VFSGPSNGKRTNAARDDHQDDLAILSLRLPSSGGDEASFTFESPWPRRCGEDYAFTPKKKKRQREKEPRVQVCTAPPERIDDHTTIEL